MLCTDNALRSYLYIIKYRKFAIIFPSHWKCDANEFWQLDWIDLTDTKKYQVIFLTITERLEQWLSF